MCIYKRMLNVYKNQQNRQTESRNLMGPKMLPTIWGTYMKLVTKYQISAINSCWEKCNWKWEYIQNVCSMCIKINSWQTGSRNLGKHLWTHQIPTSCLPTVDFYTHWTYILYIFPFSVAFFSATIDGRNLIFGHKLYIGTPYRGKRFLTRQIPTFCLPKSGVIISEH
jgi:hypothetical protein